MLFRRMRQRSCEYCIWGTRLGQEQMLCTKKGVVSTTFACRKFKYDPCKRIPCKPKALDVNKYKQSDFEL